MAVPAARTPVVFIHGLWLHADSWKPWIDLFRAAGYDPIAPGWPGDSPTVAESNAHPERIANVGIDDVVEHYAAIIRKLPAKPIVIGHSFGGLVAQKLLGMGLETRWDVELDNASLSILDGDRDSWRLVSWNDVTHLLGQVAVHVDEEESEPLAL